MSKYEFNIIQGLLEYRDWCFLSPGRKSTQVSFPPLQLTVLEGLFCKLVICTWQAACLLEVLSAVLAPTSTNTSSPGLKQYPCSTAGTAGRSWTRGFSPWHCHQPHVLSTMTPIALFRGLLMLIFREDLPLREGSVVPSTAMLWQTYKKGEINQLGIPGWKSCDGWMTCTLTINTRCTTRLRLNSQSSLTVLCVSPRFVGFKMSQLQFENSLLLFA